ncbi:MAG: acyltransferase family protein [Vulcanimicrobiaceae bacterium]
MLDGLRGIAVLLVLWYHVWEISWLPAPFPWLEFIPETGFIGVHLFFFLSGFVITYPFVRARLLGGPSPTWGHFAYRRFAKIVPSYVLSIAIAYAIGYAQTQGDGHVWRDVITHLLFVHTWWQPTYGSINGVLWTLAVEVEFYCIFPIVWWCFARRPFLSACAMIALSLIWRTWASRCCLHTSFELLEENLPGYLDIFACGMLAAWTFVRYAKPAQAERRRMLWPFVSLAGFALLAGLLVSLYDGRTAALWPFVWQIDRRPLLGVAFAIAALGLLWSPRWFARIFANAPLRFLAFISYNLYLYHQIIARELLRFHLPPYQGDPHGNLAWGLRYTLLAFATSILQATIFTYFFERPLMRLSQRRVHSRAPSGYPR